MCGVRSGIINCCCVRSGSARGSLSLLKAFQAAIPRYEYNSILLILL